MARKRKIGLIVIGVVLALGIGCAGYVNDYYRADNAAAAAMAGSAGVTVRQMEDLVVFEPETPSAGLVFYPGGKVEYTAYAPLMLALAERDVLCVIAQMPCNLAVLDRNAALEIPEQFPQIDGWYIGGHSLGGSMAASCAGENAGLFKGLVLLAAYATEELSELEVISLYGTEDTVLNMEKYEQYRGNLPEDVTEIVIDGGNHAQFGSYGAQDGDGAAGISGEEQLRITAEEIAEFIYGEK